MRESIRLAAPCRCVPVNSDVSPHVMQITTRVIVGVVVGIAGAWGGLALAAYWALPDWQTRGQFGDVFGAVNALFSGLAFAGVIFAILLQREDLELQREELALTRQELARSAQAQEQSEAALRGQAESAARTTTLSTINFLLASYRRELEELRAVRVPGGDPRLARLRELERREAVLLQKLDSLFEEVIDHERTDAVQNR